MTASSIRKVETRRDTYILVDSLKTCVLVIVLSYSRSAFSSIKLNLCILISSILLSSIC